MRTLGPSFGAWWQTAGVTREGPGWLRMTLAGKVRSSCEQESVLEKALFSVKYQQRVGNPAGERALIVG